MTVLNRRLQLLAEQEDGCVAVTAQLSVLTVICRFGFVCYMNKKNSVGKSNYQSVPARIGLCAKEATAFSAVMTVFKIWILVNCLFAPFSQVCSFNSYQAGLRKLNAENERKTIF